jgi:hypothetical protein
MPGTGAGTGTESKITGSGSDRGKMVRLWRFRFRLRFHNTSSRVVLVASLFGDHPLRGEPFYSHIFLGVSFRVNFKRIKPYIYYESEIVIYVQLSYVRSS